MGEDGQSRNRQGERPQPGEVVEPNEDQGADPGGQQPGHQHQPEHGPTDTRSLHQEERADEG